MTPERAKKLREIGFEWTTTNPRNVPWEQRFEELRSFVVSLCEVLADACLVSAPLSN